MPNSPSARAGLHNQTVERMGIGIANDEYPPGTRLANQDELAKEFGVSRTVIREAVRLLTDKGLVTSRPKIGTTVTDSSQWNLTDSDVLRWLLDARKDEMLKHVAEVRHVVEPAAAGIAAQRRTEQQLALLDKHFQEMVDSVDDYPRYIAADLEFHNTILQASANPLITQMLGTIRTALEGTRELTVTVEEGPASTLDLHSEVRDAIREQNPALAVSTMSELIEVSTEHLHRALDNQP